MTNHLSVFDVIESAKDFIQLNDVRQVAVVAAYAVKGEGGEESSAVYTAFSTASTAELVGLLEMSKHTVMQTFSSQMEDLHDEA